MAVTIDIECHSFQNKYLLCICYGYILPFLAFQRFNFVNLLFITLFKGNNNQVLILHL